MDFENIINLSEAESAVEISRIFEQDSRRYSRGLSEEQEAKAG